MLWEKWELVFMYSTHYSCPILIEFEFSLQIPKSRQLLNFTKISAVIFECDSDGQTDRRTEMQG